MPGKNRRVWSASLLTTVPLLTSMLRRYRGSRATGDTISAQRLAAVLDQAPLAFHLFTTEGTTLLTNKKWDIVWRGTTADDPGDNILADSQIRKTGLLPYLREGIAGRVTTTPPLRFDPPGGEPTRWLQGFIAPITDARGQVREVLLIEEDVTAQRDYEQQLEYRASHDPLTDLPNRTALLEHLRGAIGRATPSSSVAIFLLDFDRFKVVNDSLGHAAGDRLLILLAERLRQAVEGHHGIARLGGDEFAIMASAIASPAAARAIAQELLAAARSTATIRGQKIHAQASIGIAFSDGSILAEELLQHADMAMYAAKDAGGDQCRLFDPAMYAEIHERLILEAELRRAVEQDELVLHYQPIVDLQHDRLLGLEALVRWQHPARGLLGPHSFIPLAEETGLIGTVGAHVLRMACQQLRAWRDTYPAAADVTISVNVSARQFRREHLSLDIEHALQEAALPAAALVLELTESALMDDPEAALLTLMQFKKTGIRLAIDDFGIGYSSISQLRQLPVDQLKLDRSFIGALGRDPRGTAVVEAVLRLGQGLGLQTVAEGVESAATATQLRALGCDVAQGFYYARPLPADQVATWLVARVSEALDGAHPPVIPASAYRPVRDR